MARFYSYHPPKLKDVPQTIIRTLANLPDTYHIFLDFLIGQEADIDFAVFHEKGIYIVEVKDKHGVIDGGPNKSKWTAEENGELHEFDNPYQQVRRYANATKQFLLRHSRDILNKNRLAMFDFRQVNIFPLLCFVRFDPKSHVEFDGWTLLIKGVDSLIVNLRKRDWNGKNETKHLALESGEIERISELLGLSRTSPDELLIGRSIWRPRLDHRVREDLRVRELKELHTCFERNSVVAVVGEPMVGKSSLVQLYTKRAAADPQVKPLDHDFQMGHFGIMCERFFEALEVFPMPIEPQDRISVLLEALCKRKLLLILDNFEMTMNNDEVADRGLSLFLDYAMRYESEIESKIIVTSRRQVFTQNRNKLPVFMLYGIEQQAALPYLMTEYDLSDEQAREIFTATNGNPHAMHVAGSRIKDYGRSGVMGYHELIRGGLRDVGEKLYHDYTRLIHSENTLIDFISLIPLGTTIEALRSICSPLHLDLQGGVDEAVLKLHQLGMVSLAGEGRVRLLPLLWEFVYNKLNDKILKHTMAYSYYSKEFSTGKYSEAEDITTHVLYHATRADLAKETVTHLFSEGLWDKLELSGKYETLLEICKQLKLCKSLEAVDLNDRALLLLNEGRVLGLIGDITMSRKMIEEAQKIYKNLGNNLGQGACLVELGMAIRKGGGLGKPEGEYYEKALSILENRDDLSAKRIKCTALGRLARAKEFMGEDLEKIIQIREKALSLALDTSAMNLVAAQLGALGGSYLRARNFEKAFECHTKAVAISRDIRNDYRLGNSLSGLARVNAELPKPRLERARDLYLESLEVTHDVFGRIDRLGSLGYIYIRLGDLDTAERYYREALSLAEMVENKKAMAENLAGIGSIYRMKSDHDISYVNRACEYLGRAIQIQEQIEGDFGGRANRYGEMGRILIKAKEFERAKRFYANAIGLAKLSKRKHLEGWLLEGLGDAFSGINEFEESGLCYERSISILKGERFPQRVLRKKQKILANMDDAARAKLEGRYKSLELEVETILKEFINLQE